MAMARTGTRSTRTTCNRSKRSSSATRAGFRRSRSELGGLHFDWSKTHLDAGLLERFVAIAEATDFAAARDSLFAGRDRQPDRRPGRRACRRARNRARPMRSSWRQAAAAGCALLSTRSRQARSAILPASSTSASADPCWGRPCSWTRWAATRFTSRRSLPFQYRWRGARRCRLDPRSGNDPDRRRLEDLHHHRDHVQPECRHCLASRGRRGRSLSAG